MPCRGLQRSGCPWTHSSWQATPAHHKVLQAAQRVQARAGRQLQQVQQQEPLGDLWLGCGLTTCDG